MDASHAHGHPHLHPVFCTVVPPHLLDKIAQSEDTRRADAAQRTLEQDSFLRTRRRVTTVRGITPALGTPVADDPRRTVYDAQHRTRLPGKKVRGEGGPVDKDATVNRAYAGLGATYELFLKSFGRHSIDDAGLPLDATVHYSEDYNNAFWDGRQMVFGDGDGDLFLDFTVSVDVIGHELTHGVTQYSANLEYRGQSGALNESMSDVFGSLIKQYSLDQTAQEADWLIGAGLLGPNVSGVALRSMKAPGTAYDDDELGKDPQPATMDGYVETHSDNGGVHINSGIPNHAFYIAATELGGKAWERAGQIWYDALTGGELSSQASFADFARLSVAAAVARYGDGGAEHQALQKAWSAVGVPST
ncbi:MULTISPECIES: M4 family metallopeptidase [unclassified Streptomyces]|uniref:M4 family metallopeptidase n=1 Tax=unclassified Streptomyces TaxID=2593676 RepID=UPI001BE682E1|nr:MULTISPECIES: M4 family metallopeptidase [unclassified Streptomyces]MBT2404332.1 M4 family metallopeptidase [Streptomyces sp. ISL-21]MBT2458123.1 M4 family metallopeptidase [Streptomyces sp. ISL-86]MBT2607117.1 M4 family metallopeptidase [Streptomyces sp. ISL-87]